MMALLNKSEIAMWTITLLPRSCSPYYNTNPLNVWPLALMQHPEGQIVDL